MCALTSLLFGHSQMDAELTVEGAGLDEVEEIGVIVMLLVILL